MTQLQNATTLYGPVAEDLILVEDLLEATKRTELAPLKRMLDHALDARGKRMRPASSSLPAPSVTTTSTAWSRWALPSSSCIRPASSTTTWSMAP
jgi:hypothetical protein